MKLEYGPGRELSRTVSNLPKPGVGDHIVSVIRPPLRKLDLLVDGPWSVMDGTVVEKYGHLMVSQTLVAHAA